MVPGKCRVHGMLRTESDIIQHLKPVKLIVFNRKNKYELRISEKNLFSDHLCKHVGIDGVKTMPRGFLFGR